MLMRLTLYDKYLGQLDLKILPLSYLLDNPGCVSRESIPCLVEEISPRVGESHQVWIQVDQEGAGVVPLPALGQVLEVQACLSLGCHRHDVI